MVSVIVPFYNEAENLPILLERLIRVLDIIKEEWEVVLVDDGSNDSSKLKLKTQSDKIHIINHRKRFGKGQALRTGVEVVQGDIIIFMDADLQDDPKDLPAFLKKVKDGYDFVNGIRAKRKDNVLIKTYSSLAGYVLRAFFGSPYSDINCGFKAFKREVLSEFAFYGNNFRFFPLAAYYGGYKVTEIPVTNNPRRFGVSKFGVSKLFVGIFDMLTAYFIYKFAEQPLHFFGIVGGAAFSIGFAIAFYLSIERIFFGVLLFRRPILWFAILLIVVGVQIITTGIIGELIVYLNKKSQK